MSVNAEFEPGYRQINFRVSPELFQAVEDAARTRKLTKSKFLGKIVAAAIDELMAEHAPA